MPVESLNKTDSSESSQVKSRRTKWMTPTKIRSNFLILVKRKILKQKSKFPNQTDESDMTKFVSPNEADGSEINRAYTMQKPGNVLDNFFSN